jgi:3-oxoacyl-[acyl-carrier-protein] synthase II
MRPLDLDEQTAIAGEGAAFLLLTRQVGPGGYAMVKEVDLVFCSEKFAVPVPPEAVEILGADGHRSTGSKYRGFVNWGRAVVCYTPYYGSLPVGFGFQLAAAALMTKEGKIFATPGPLPADRSFQVIAQEQNLNARPICCVLRGTGESLALATVGHA